MNSKLWTILVSLTALLATPLGARAFSDERADSIFKRLDTDGSERIELSEMHTALDGFYTALRDGKDRAKVLAEHEDVISLNEFLAADLNDDLVLTREELAALPKCSEAMMMLCEADIDLLVADFEARILKAIRLYTADYNRGSTRGGRTSKQKRELQSRPYRRTLESSVLALRIELAERRQVNAKDVDTFFVDDWVLRYSRTDDDGKTTELDARAFHDPEVSGRPQGSGDTSIILQTLKIRRSDYINRLLFENYKFDVETSTVLLDLDGSQVQCNTLTCRLGSRHATISVHPEYSFLPVASERGDGLSVWRSKLIELKKLTD